MAAQLVRSESAGLSPVGSNVRGVPKVVRWAVWGTCSSYRTDCRRSRLTGPPWTSTSSTACDAAATICPRPLQMVTWTATQSGLVTLTFDLWNLEVMRNVSCGTDNLPANFAVSVRDISLSSFIGKHGSNWRRDVITLTFDLWGTAHVGDAGHRTPSVFQLWSS